MLRNRFLILLAACFLAASAAWADDIGFIDCSSHSEGTQVFGKPRKSNDVVANLSCGERFTVLVYGFYFSRIQTRDGQIGYVYSNLIALDHGVTSIQQVPPQATQRPAQPAIEPPALQMAAEKTKIPRTPPADADSAPAAPTQPQPAAAAAPPAPAQVQPPQPPVTPTSAPAATESAPASTAPAPATSPVDQPATAAPPNPVASAQPEPAPAPVQPQPEAAPSSPAEPPASDATATPPAPAAAPAPPQPDPAQPAASQPPASTSNPPDASPASTTAAEATPPAPEPEPAAPQPPAAQPEPAPAQPAPAAAQPEPAPAPIKPADKVETWEKPRAVGRTAPLMELYGGFAFARMGGTSNGSNLIGALGSFGWNPKSWLQVVADTSYSYQTVGTTKNVLYGNHFGPRFFYRSRHRWGFTPFVEGLVGGSSLNTTVSGTGGYSSSTGSALSYKIGGGIDIHPSRHWDVRLFDVDYYRTSFSGATQSNNYWISAGIVLRLFGGSAE